MKRHPTTSRQLLETQDFGFSLIELLFVIAIAAIFAAMAAPSFRDFIAGQRIKTASYDISYALTGARSEAIKRNLNVVLAPVSGNWQNGWTVTTGATTIAQHEPFVDLTITGPAAGLTYNSSGRLAAAVAPFAISSSVSAGAAPRCVLVDLSGLPSSKAGAC
ncbi:GspH/FimT family pseudopilin [Polaromonas sp.]|uniref:GspH/FimT family pseudopilin n=1 Tax=Polaromonas sp. TaxID=1869339 RepID=UPI002FC802F3